jgi:hypothetical protein
VNYKLLLQKYINHVKKENTDTFIAKMYYEKDRFTKEE